LLLLFGLRIDVGLFDFERIEFWLFPDLTVDNYFLRSMDVLLRAVLSPDVFDFFLLLLMFRDLEGLTTSHNASSFLILFYYLLIFS